MQKVKMEVIQQGAPIVNSATIIKKGPEVVAVEVDLRSKRCETMGHGRMDDGSPTVLIEANEESLHLNGSVPHDKWTEIGFPEFKGWQIWSENLARYTLRLCLVKTK